MRKTLTMLGLSMALATAPLAAAPLAVLGQWQGDFKAAQAQARELGVPLLVVWGTPTCSKCKKFDEQLAEAQAYLAGRGIVLFREKADAKPVTAAKQWVGEGKYPLLRVTWERGGVSLADFRWSRPASFADFRETLEGQIGDYRPGR